MTTPTPDDVTKLLEELENHIATEDRIFELRHSKIRLLLAHIRHQQERIATLERENRDWKELLRLTDEVARMEANRISVPAKMSFAIKKLRSSLSRT